MSVHVIDEASRCLQCPNPRCRENGCPIHTNIPEMIRLFKENKMMEAAEMLFENNPLSMICSLVCNLLSYFNHLLPMKIDCSVHRTEIED